jgi:hypothetical protein
VQRDLLDDGLVVIVNALEAGTNESPVHDEITGLPRPRGLGPITHMLFYVKISQRTVSGSSITRTAERATA